MSYAYGSQYKTYQQAFAAYEDMCASCEVMPSEVEGIIKRGKYWYILVREVGPDVMGRAPNTKAPNI